MLIAKDKTCQYVTTVDIEYTGSHIPTERSFPYKEDRYVQNCPK